MIRTPLTPVLQTLRQPKTTASAWPPWGPRQCPSPASQTLTAACCSKSWKHHKGDDIPRSGMVSISLSSPERERTLQGLPPQDEPEPCPCSKPGQWMLAIHPSTPPEHEAAWELCGEPSPARTGGLGSVWQDGNSVFCQLALQLQTSLYLSLSKAAQLLSKGV